ncbi:MAG: hypothetical protein K6G81_11350 [Lachnospiraceae bacterium]|nr:hypothetical protein [Lachnospiraceae bacterium]
MNDQRIKETESRKNGKLIRVRAGKAVGTVAACALTAVMMFEAVAAPLPGYAAEDTVKDTVKEMETVTITMDELKDLSTGGKYLYSVTDGVGETTGDAAVLAKEGLLAGELALDGGYQAAKSPVITKKRAKLFKKAFKGFVGSDVTPVAYLASQVVAGTNHKYLCRIKGVYPGAVENYAFVTIYEDLEGNVSINEIVNTEVETRINELPGGWFQADSAKVTKDVKKAFKKAMKGLVGVNYKPVAVTAYQVVAGMNYCVLCESTVVYPGAQTGYSLVYFYKGLDGSAELNDIVKLDTDREEEPVESGTLEPEHSMNTLLVTVDENASKKKIEKIFKKLGLTILYDYTIISGYAVSLAEDTDEEGLNDLIKKLEAYDEIVLAEKDYIYHLD